MITWWMKLEGNLPLGHDALLFSTIGKGLKKLGKGWNVQIFGIGMPCKWKPDQMYKS